MRVLSQGDSGLAVWEIQGVMRFIEILQGSKALLDPKIRLVVFGLMVSVKSTPSICGLDSASRYFARKNLR